MFTRVVTSLVQVLCQHHNLFVTQALRKSCVICKSLASLAIWQDYKSGGFYKTFITLSAVTRTLCGSTFVTSYQFYILSDCVF